MRFPAAVGLACLLVPSIASAQIAVEVDARGVVQEVKVGGVVYLDDVAVSLVKPGGAGSLADQRGVDPGSVHVFKDGATTTYAMPLEGESFTGQLIERVTRKADEVELGYEVIPDADMEIECILLRGSIAAATHAGKTSYRIGPPESARGVLPRDLDAERSILYGGDPQWLAFVAPGVDGVRVTPRDMGLRLRDDRKRNAPMFRLLAAAGGGEHLMRKPIRFGLSLRAEPALRPEGASPPNPSAPEADRGSSSTAAPRRGSSSSRRR